MTVFHYSYLSLQSSTAKQEQAVNFSNVVADLFIQEVDTVDYKYQTYGTD